MQRRASGGGSGPGDSDYTAANTALACATPDQFEESLNQFGGIGPWLDKGTTEYLTA